MTHIGRTKQHTFINLAFVFLCGVFGLGILYLVVLYNQSVNLGHEVRRMKSEWENIEIQNSELKEAMFSIFSTENLERLAKERNLIKDKQPLYFKLSQQWPSDSR